MNDTEPLDLDAEEDLLVRWENRIGDIPLPAMSNTERLIHDLGFEVRRLREAMQLALDDIERYGGDILRTALHPEEDDALEIE